MTENEHPGHQILKELADNSAALVASSIRLKANSDAINGAMSQAQVAQQRGNALLGSFQAQVQADNRAESRVWKGVFAIAIIAGLVAYLIYPDWLPEQLANLSSLMQPE